MELSDDNIQANAVMYLLEGQENEAARILLVCKLESAVVSIADDLEGDTSFGLRVKLMCSRATMGIINDENSPISSQIKAALDAVAPSDYWIESVRAYFEIQELDADWRERLANMASGKEVNNQGIAHGNVPLAPITWKGLKFRSQTEVRIAEALEAEGVLFFPNCLCRINVGDNRETREADFLICIGAKWGILEVDGPYHQGRAAYDHQRDRLFKNYGIRVVERYPWDNCYHHARDVVQMFLALLKTNG